MSNKRKLTNGTNESGSHKKSASTPSWNLSLKSYLDNTESAEYADDKIVIIKDKYPKAKYHFLVLPRESIPNLKSLTKDHIELLQYMQAKGQTLAESCKSKVEFKYGYHAVPSMSHLHLHVISQDFDSSCLKTKKHWNSFTTNYFILSDDIIKQLQEKGKCNEISPEFSKTLLNSSLRCHRCRVEFSTMPKLKQHILVHIPK